MSMPYVRVKILTRLGFTLNRESASSSRYPDHS